MLDNEITLEVDSDLNGTPENRIFTRFEERQNVTDYIQKDSHLDETHREILQFGRSTPKTSGDYLGVLRPTVKITIDTAVLSASGATIRKPLIYTLTGSLPVGYDPVIELRARQLICSWLSHSDYEDFAKLREI